MTSLKPQTFYDFKKGRISDRKVNTFLIPDNSAGVAINVDFERKMGSVVPRRGADQLTALAGVAHGTGTFINASGSIDIYLVAVADKIQVWNGTTLSPATGTINAVNQVRFEALGNKIFRANGQPMQSSSDGITWSTDDCLTGYSPTLLLRTKSHMLAAGDSTIPDRIFFSSVINPTVSPFITWNTTTFASANGGWIDVNPDDGFNLTALQETSDTTLAFKENAFYRIDAITKSVNPTNVYNVGTPRQETTTRCKGQVYFFTNGKEIMRTDGNYPEQISRIAVQDYLDSVVDESKVNLYSDYNNVYVALGDVVLDGRTRYNVTLKFNTLDESWTTYEHPRFIKDGKTYKGVTTAAANELLVGSLVRVNTGWTDFGVPVTFNFETQSCDMGNLHVKGISDRIVYATKNAASTGFYVILDKESKVSKTIDLGFAANDFVTASTSQNLNFRTITFGWYGANQGGTSNTEPELLLILVENIDDLGLFLPA